ncbi:hypothetical protein GJAV_G00141060 [Gymnothorax javanicus]|nr:hypothetical protein GJAV_G00141060 [Gymnothorax javanicus]
MAESETECAAPGLNTLEPECVTAHSGVSDVHHTHTSLIKTETDLGSTHSGDLIKMESLDSTELGYVTHLHPDQIKTETDDGGYHEAEDISDLQDIKCVNARSDLLKSEYCEVLVDDLMDTMMNGAGVGQEDQCEPWQCAGESNPCCKIAEIHNLPSNCGDLNHHFDRIDETTLCNKKYVHSQTMNMMIVPKIGPSSKISSLLRVNQNMTIHKHGETHLFEKPHKCTQCEKSFCKKFDLKTHMRIHSGEKPYKCAQCGKCFCRKSDLSTHLRIHTGEKPYKCTQCGKNFSHTSGLKCHKMVHTGEKPYTCLQCGKCFSKISHLKSHQRVHTGEKPYECTQCGKCFSHRSGFNCHQMSHTGEKPYKCPDCDKCFCSISHLNIHHRIHTGERPYKCIQCAKGFSQKSTLNRHMMTHIDENPSVVVRVI